METAKQSKKPIICYAFLIGIIYRILMGLQGFGSGDMGACMTFYQNIFSHPESMSFYFNYYLTGFLGGLWQHVMGDFGLQGFRMLEVATRAAAIALLYGAFRPYIVSKKVAARAILLSFMFPSYIITFHYNTFSMLILAIAIYFFMQGCVRKSALYMFCAGTAFGISLFARTVNIALLPLVLVPMISYSQSPMNERIKATAYHLAGTAAGIAATICLLWATGHLGYFMEGVREAFDSFNTSKDISTDTHTFGNVALSYVLSYKNLFSQIFAIMVILELFIYSYGFKLSWQKPMRTFLLTLLAVLVFTSLPYVTTLAACTLLCILCFRESDNSKPFWIPLTYALIATFLYPFGSDTGLTQLFNHIAPLLIFPAACCVETIKEALVRRFLVFSYTFIALSLFSYSFFNPNEEDEPRWKLTTIALKGTLNVFTDNEKAQTYQNIVSKIKQHSQQTNTLIVVNQGSELYYATGLLPFMGNMQVNNFEGNRLKEHLNKQERKHKDLPIVVFLKEKSVKDQWKSKDVFLEWMGKHQYANTYEDSDLTIYKVNHSPY